jgi:biopolymer transport protein ExbB/TolQ
MREIFWSGGFMMWPLLMVGVGVLFLGIRGAWRMSRASVALPEMDGTLQSILFWGVVAVVLGLLGTVVGLVQMAQAIARFANNGVTAATVGGGFSVSLITLIFGLLILLVSMLSWYSLRQWASRRASPNRGTALA